MARRYDVQIALSIEASDDKEAEEIAERIADRIEAHQIDGVYRTFGVESVEWTGESDDE